MSLAFRLEQQQQNLWTRNPDKKRGDVTRGTRPTSSEG
jgi:hypothetical protein